MTRRPLAAALAALSLAALVLAAPAAAQAPAKNVKVPKRPKLEAGADTNDALAYYRFGNAQLRRDPDAAERAFYWASRLAPSWSDPYYGRWAALMLRSNYRSKEDRKLSDSLEVAAAERNPFLFRRLDRQVLEELVNREVGTEYTSEVMFELSRSNGDPATDAFRAYQSSRFGDAVAYYAKAITKYKKRPWLHEDRALAFYQLQQYDSAATELDAFLAALRVREDTALGHAYLSKAFAEYQLGSVHLLRGDTAAARAAFGRALAEDLSYAPAHVALSGIAADAKDRATALAEAEAASQVHEDDAVLHYTYARSLIEAGRADDAERELKRAQTLEPFFAMPYYLLGRLYDNSSMEDEAAVQYEAFLAHGARQFEEYGWTRDRLAALKAAAAAPVTTPPPAGKGG